MNSSIPINSYFKLKNDDNVYKMLGFTCKKDKIICVPEGIQPHNYNGNYVVADVHQIERKAKFFEAPRYKN